MCFFQPWGLSNQMAQPATQRHDVSTVVSRTHSSNELSYAKIRVKVKTFESRVFEMEYIFIEEKNIDSFRKSDSRQSQSFDKHVTIGLFSLYYRPGKTYNNIGVSIGFSNSVVEWDVESR